MNSYWVEVKRDSTNKNVLMGLWDVAGITAKPSCEHGGDNCLPISQEVYGLLKVFHGDLDKASDTIKNLRKWLKTDKGDL